MWAWKAEPAHPCRGSLTGKTGRHLTVLSSSIPHIPPLAGSSPARGASRQPSAQGCRTYLLTTAAGRDRRLLTGPSVRPGGVPLTWTGKCQLSPPAYAAAAWRDMQGEPDRQRLPMRPEPETAGTQNPGCRFESGPRRQPPERARFANTAQFLTAKAPGREGSARARQPRPGDKGRPASGPGRGGR